MDSGELFAVMALTRQMLMLYVNSLAIVELLDMALLENWGMLKRSETEVSPYKCNYVMRTTTTRRDYTKLRECATTSYAIEARLHADDVSLTNQV